MFNKVGVFVLGLLIVLFMIFIGQLPSLFLGLFEPIFNKNNTIISILFFLVWLILFIGVIKFIWSYYKRKSHDVDTKITIHDIFRAFCIFLVGRVIAILGMNLMQMVYGNPESKNDSQLISMFDSERSVYSILILTIIVAVAGPVIEELTFRGIPTVLLFMDSPKWVPMIVTSLAFSAVHLSSNIISFAMYALLGALMYWAYSSRGRIVDSMLVHFFNNILGAIMLFYSYFGG